MYFTLHEIYRFNINQLFFCLERFRDKGIMLYPLNLLAKKTVSTISQSQIRTMPEAFKFNSLLDASGRYKSCWLFEDCKYNYDCFTEIS